MKSFSFVLLLSCLSFLSACNQSSSLLKEESSKLKFTFADTICTDGLPCIGKWMYQADTQRANWLGVKYMNKNLIEPVNIILKDSISVDEAEAIETLAANLLLAGYESRPLHTGGYLGFIDTAFYHQLPSEKNHAFSNHNAWLNNNHARIFGPLHYGNYYIFIAAVSRENFVPFQKVKHSFSSFNAARDALAKRMDLKSKYKISNYINLHNSILNDSINTTADHDGMAILLQLR